MGVSPTCFMLSMNPPRCIFIKCQTDWSYNYIGAIKEFIELSPAVLTQYYAMACAYLVLRHNFCSGHLDNQAYTTQVTELFRPLHHVPHLNDVVQWNCETLYRLVRPILHVHHCPITQVSYTNDDHGDILGIVVHYQTPYHSPSMQFP